MTDSGTPPAQSTLCEHHPQHDEDCGYTEGTAGTPCTYEHTEDCYTFVTDCVHEHTAECYPAESVSENTATVKPDEATNKNVTWSSDNTGVATVDTNGQVTAVGAGSTIIKAPRTANPPPAP